MADMNSCLLGKDASNEYCKNLCGSCGWNPKIAKARSEDIAANGLTLCSDGLRRYVIRREAGNNDSDI